MLAEGEAEPRAHRLQSVLLGAVRRRCALAAAQRAEQQCLVRGGGEQLVGQRVVVLEGGVQHGEGDRQRRQRAARRATRRAGRRARRGETSRGVRSIGAAGGGGSTRAQGGRLFIV